MSTTHLRSVQKGLFVEGLHKSYKKRPILIDVSFSVKRGEAVALLGPNGAGKTTCFYSVMGAIRPDRGQIILDGINITQLPMYQRARLGLGYLPQEPSIFRGLNVEDNIRLVLQGQNLMKPDEDQALEELLEEFSIRRLRKSPSMALSGGERRRLEIARALAARPSFILLDEPLAGIDPISIGDIRDLIVHLKDRGIGVLITDHNVRDTLSIVDRATILHSGKIISQGTPEEVVKEKDVQRVYLGEHFNS